MTSNDVKKHIIFKNVFTGLFTFQGNEYLPLKYSLSKFYIIDSCRKTQKHSSFPETVTWKLIKSLM